MQMFIRMKQRGLPSLSGLLTLAVLLLAIPIQSVAQDPDVPFVGTPQSIVDSMLNLAGVGAGDYLIDLGSGDGRIVIAAAKRGAVGHGVEIDAELVEWSEEIAIDEGVGERVMFLHEDIFETDISHATVVTLYLSPAVNLELRPVLLEQLAPGTRVVSHLFSMGAWQPDRTEQLGNHRIHYWNIPADAGGSWSLNLNDTSFRVTISQQFQEITADIQSGHNGWSVKKAELYGTQLTLTVTDRTGSFKVLNGRIDGDIIHGFAQVRSGDDKLLIPWSAKRKPDNQN
jgi:hypothetical protein